MHQSELSGSGGRTQSNPKHGAQVEEQTPLAAAEVYLFTWRGHLCFLPGLPWLPLGRWHLPKSQVSQ